MAAANVQATAGGSDTGTGASSVATSAFGSSTTTGNAIFVAIYWYDSPITITSVQDTAGNSYTPVGTTYTDTLEAQQCAHYYALNITGGASQVVTANFSTAAAQYKRIVAHEASGIATSSALDKDSVGKSQTGTSVTDNAVTTTTNGQYIFSSVMNVSGTATFSSGAGFSEPANSTAGAANFEAMAQYQIQGTAGSVTAAFNVSASNECAMRTSTFKAAAGGGSTTTLDATTASSYTVTGSTAADKFTLTAGQAGA
jgi:hypothetical protein